MSKADDKLASRDYVMARLGGAGASLEAAADGVFNALALFVNPDDDSRGKQRKDLMAEALEACGAASRGLEDAVEAMDDADMKAGEPWEDESDDDDEDDEDDDE